LRGMDCARRFRMRTEAELDRIAHEIIGCAIAVHRAVGPGCFESTYQPCLACELNERGLAFQTKVAIPLRYRAMTIARAYEADFIVEESVVVELKAVAVTGPLEDRQLQTYLKLSGCPLGLLLNFGALLMADGVIRKVNNFPQGCAPYNVTVGRT
jgi:GxxExxY protein